MHKGGENMDRIKIGKKLKDLRGNRKIDEVAEALNVSKSALCMYERGERIPRDEIKVRISQYYGHSIEEIFFAS